MLPNGKQGRAPMQGYHGNTGEFRCKLATRKSSLSYSDNSVKIVALKISLIVNRVSGVRYGNGNIKEEFHFKLGNSVSLSFVGLVKRAKSFNPRTIRYVYQNLAQKGC